MRSGRDSEPRSPGGRSIERGTTVLVPRKHGLRLLEPSEGDEGLDVVRNEAHLTGLPNSRCTRLGDERLEVRVGLERLLEGDGEEPERPCGNALHERCVRAVGELGQPRRSRGPRWRARVGLDQGPAGEEKRRVRGLSRLEDDLLTRFDVTDGIVPRSGEAFDLARSGEYPGVGNLVAVLERAGAPP